RVHAELQIVFLRDLPRRVDFRTAAQELRAGGRCRSACRCKRRERECDDSFDCFSHVTWSVPFVDYAADTKLGSLGAFFSCSILVVASAMASILFTRFLYRNHTPGMSRMPMTGIVSTITSRIPTMLSTTFRQDGV